MYFILFLIIVPALLLAFIAWDRRRPVKPQSRQSMEQDWRPRELPLWHGYAAMGFFAALICAQELHSPAEPPFSGRWSFVYVVLHERLGPHGKAYLWLALAAVFGWLAFLSWLRGWRLKVSALG